MSAPQYATERIYRTADDRVVFGDDPDAAFLLAAVGDEIPEGYKVPARARTDTAVKAAATPDNKAVTVTDNKAASSPFDPADHTVDEVVAHLRKADANEAARVLSAESADKKRVGVLSFNADS